MARTYVFSEPRCPFLALHWSNITRHGSSLPRRRVLQLNAYPKTDVRTSNLRTVGAFLLTVLLYDSTPCLHKTFQNEDVLLNYPNDPDNLQAVLGRITTLSHQESD